MCFGSDNRFYIVNGVLKIVIDNNIVIFVAASLNFPDGDFQAAENIVLLLASAVAKPSFKNLHARRHDEYTDGIGIHPFDISCSLHVNFQNYNMSVIKPFIDRSFRSAVVVNAVTCIFKQLAVFNRIQEILFTDKHIIYSVYFGISRLSRCH